LQRLGTELSIVFDRRRANKAGAMRPGLVARLMLAYSAVVAVLLLAAWWGQHSLADAERSARQLSELGVETVRLTSSLQSILQDKGRVADFLISGDRPVLAAVRPHRVEFQRWLEQMSGFVSTEREQSLLEHIRATYGAYTTKADQVVSLQEQKRDREAQQRFAEMANDVEVLLGDTQQLFTLIQSHVRERRTRTDEIIDRAEKRIAWITGAGAILSLVLGFVLSRYAARPIYRLALRLGSSGIVDEVAVAGGELGVIEARVDALIGRTRQQERALQEAETLAELGEIASQIAHETLNPLAGVKGMLQALRRTELPRDALAKELEDMEHELDRVERIVRRLMDYARPLAPHVEQVSVRRLLEDAARSARLLPAARGRSLRVAPIPADATWRMDPDLIRQVLVNLLVNGCEASPPGSTVELQAAVDDGRLSLVVEDHGVGVPPDVRERLFRPFFSTKRNGNGLGLAVSRKIVREHGGQIEALPGGNGGSVFRVLLPADQAMEWRSPS
jgi:signal transduction histidine kinase